MARLVGSYARAEEASTPLQAARLHHDLEHELEGSPELEGTPAAQEAERALALLRDRWGEHEMRNHPASEKPPKISRRAQRGLGQHDEHRDPPAEDKPEREERSKPEPFRDDNAGLSWLGDRAEDLVPKGVGKSSDFAMLALRTMVGLSLVYLLVNEQGGGPGAFSGLLNGITDATRLFIGPFDPLGGTAQLHGKPASKPAGGKPVSAKQADATAAAVPGIAAITAAQSAQGAATAAVIPGIGAIRTLPRKHPLAR